MHGFWARQNEKETFSGIDIWEATVSAFQK